MQQNIENKCPMLHTMSLETLYCSQFSVSQQPSLTNKLIHLPLAPQQQPSVTDLFFCGKIHLYSSIETTHDHWLS